MSRCALLLEDATQCDGEGEWLPVICLRVSRFGPTARGLLHLPICDEHKKNIKLKDVMNDDGWESIEKNLLQQGFKKPRRELTYLEWQRAPA